MFSTLERVLGRNGVDQRQPAHALIEHCLIDLRPIEEAVPIPVERAWLPERVAGALPRPHQTTLDKAKFHQHLVRPKYVCSMAHQPLKAPKGVRTTSSADLPPTLLHHADLESISPE